MSSKPRQIAKFKYKSSMPSVLSCRSDFCPRDPSAMDAFTQGCELRGRQLLHRAGKLFDGTGSKCMTLNMEEAKESKLKAGPNVNTLLKSRKPKKSRLSAAISARSRAPLYVCRGLI